MNQETIVAIKDALAPVAAKIGEGAEYSWQILVKGQYAEGWALLVVGACLLTLAIIVTIGACIWWRTTEEYDDTRVVLIVVPALIWVFGGTVGGIMIYEGLIRVLAPEYAALKYLIQLAS